MINTNNSEFKGIEIKNKYFLICFKKIAQPVWIIDTDYSLDDQIALEYLLKNIKVIAITVCGAGTVSPAVIKAKIEYDLKNRYKIEGEIPVYAGADRPFIDYHKELKDDEIYDSYNYEKTDYSIFIEEVNKTSSEKVDINVKISNMAAVKIAELVRSNEKNLNILALGPLTNISLAVLIDYSIKDKFDNLLIVGGSYHNLGNSGNSAEYNFRVDPVAAKNVIHYYKNITLIPLEIEEHLKLGGIGDLKTKHSILNKFYDHLSEETEESRSRHSFLGLFGAIVATNPNTQKIVNLRPTDVDIIGRYTRGSLAIEKYEYLKSGKFNEIKIVEDVDLEKFKIIFKESFTIE